MSTSATPQEMAEFSQFVPYLGMFISGDACGFTIYTTKRGKIVWYPAAPALKPPSPLQVKQRLRFKLAQSQWMQQSKSVIAAWEKLTKVLSLPLTGQNLYIKLALNPANDLLANACAKAHIVLTPPTVVPM